MLNEEAKDYVCPFMFNLCKVGHLAESDQVQCIGPKCMAWNPIAKGEGYCNLAFPNKQEV